MSRTLFLLIPIFLSSVICRSQDNLSADSLYTLARQAAFDDKEYHKAISLGQEALMKNPDYTDVRVFIGRIYTWNNQPDSARLMFDTVINSGKAGADLFSAYTDLEYWNNKDSAALNTVSRGLIQFPGDVPLLYRKALIFNKLKDYRSAALVLDTVLSIDRGHAEARALSMRIRENISLNRIGVRYDYVYFDRQFADAWHLASIDYTRQTKLGSLTARINYANRFARTGLQYELDAYPSISRTFYGYLNIGFSDSAGVFPKYKGGASLYANLPKAFEGELGVRYLFFTDPTYIYTVYLGKYYKSFLFGARTYLSRKSGKLAQTYNVSGRYYFGGADDYFSLTLGAGISPDDRLTNVQYDLFAGNLRTYRSAFDLRFSVRTLNVISFGLSFVSQEYLPGTLGNQFQAGVGYIRRF
ncbi:MAG: YaiO family outer membrane beta-barrel protein [Sphingobacteriales bacterium]|nr:MAG: YaiO family outer membrane beta-barrel protein [Sphingobacteriales bacterium]